MRSDFWLKALCLSLLVIIVVGVGILLLADSLSRQTSFALAAVMAIVGLLPVVFVWYHYRVAGEVGKVNGSVAKKT